MTKKLRMMLLVLAFIVVFSSVAFADPYAPGQTGAAFDQKVVARVDGNRLIEHIRVLSEDIGPRVAGTDAEWAAAEYIADILESYGYETEIQEFVSRTSVTRSLVQLSPVEETLNPGSMTGSGNTPVEGITAELVYCGLGYEEDFTQDVTGKIVLIERGVLSFGEKAQNAFDKGAIGVIIFNNTSGNLSGSLGKNFSIPIVSLRQDQGQYLLEQLASGPVKVKLTVATTPLAYSPNVIASKPPKHKDANDQIVLLTAHMDSVANAPGANDNASGVAGVLELARILKSYQSKREVRFVLFGAEEIGLVGSYYYVASLPDEELERIVAVYNMDMVGTSWGDESILIAWTADGQRNIVTDTAIAAGARLTSAVLPARTTRSDHYPFHLAGIPAACFLRLPMEPYYHRPTDTIEMNIGKDRIEDSIKIIGAAAYSVIRPESPSLENSKIGKIMRDIEENLDLIIEEHMEAYEDIYVPSL